MDSGPFLDIIPNVLKYLDMKSLVYLAQTCHFWKNRIYTDVKLWPKTIELPYIDCINNYIGGGQENTLERVLEAKLWSAILPPKDPKALEKVLEKIASSEESIQRFAWVE